MIKPRLPNGEERRGAERRKAPPRRPPTKPVPQSRRDDREKALGVLSLQIAGLDRELRAALERKPNQALQNLVDTVKQCAYQLKAQRAELDQLALQLEANTTTMARLPNINNATLPRAVAAAVSLDIDRLGESFVMFRRGHDPCRLNPSSVVLARTALSQSESLKTV